MATTDAFCCTPPTTIPGICEGIKHAIAVEDVQENGAARAYPTSTASC
jgi:hypothetical protein